MEADRVKLVNVMLSQKMQSRTTGDGEFSPLGFSNGMELIHQLCISYRAPDAISVRVSVLPGESLSVVLSPDDFFTQNVAISEPVPLKYQNRFPIV